MLDTIVCCLVGWWRWVLLERHHHKFMRLNDGKRAHVRLITVTYYKPFDTCNLLIVFVLQDGYGDTLLTSPYIPRPFPRGVRLEICGGISLDQVFQKMYRLGLVMLLLFGVLRLRRMKEVFLHDLRYYKEVGCEVMAEVAVGVELRVLFGAFWSTDQTSLTKFSCSSQPSFVSLF